MVSELDKAWMAGFVDGEGCLTISRQIRKDRPSPAYRAFITISQTEREVLESFKANYGGEIYSLHERRKDKHGTKWADSWDWYCQISNASRFLSDIRPYLRVKAKQADIILDFIRTKSSERLPRQKTGTRGGSSAVTPEQLAIREEFRIAVQLLNRKGKRAREACRKVTMSS